MRFINQHRIGGATLYGSMLNARKTISTNLSSLIIMKPSDGRFHITAGPARRQGKRSEGKPRLGAIAMGFQLESLNTQMIHIK